MKRFELQPKLTKLPPLQPGRKGVRLVKDVLRVGKWFVGTDDAGKPRYAEFTSADLNAIAKRFAEHQAAGHRHPLNWGHRRSQLDMDVHPQDNAADIADVWVENDTLYFSVYAEPALLTELTSQPRQVSIGLMSDWTDGNGKHWPGHNLMHIGIVSHAAVPQQEPFVELGRGKASRALSPMDIAIAKAELVSALPGGGRRGTH